MMKNSFSLGLLVFFLILLAGTAFFLRQGTTGQIGNPVPAFDADGLDRERIIGQMAAVNFFASWCLPCQAEHETIMALSQTLPVYGINHRDTKADREVYLRENGDPYTATGDDPQGSVAAAWHVSGLPVTFIIDPEGTIIYRHDGPLLPETVEKLILPLIREYNQKRQFSAIRRYSS